MNTLLFALIRALRRHAWLRLMACAFVFSSLGNGLTQVVVFGQLLRWQAAPATLTFAWLLALLPGFLGSLLGERLCQRYSPLRILLAGEALGLLALIFPLAGLHLHSIPLLLAVQSAEALLSGMTWPALTQLFKRGLTQDELPAATAMENLIFASQVLLGTGLGVLLFGRVDPQWLLGIDALSFVMATLLLWRCAGRFNQSVTPQEATDSAPVRWRLLTRRQQRSLLLLLALAAVGAPAMALLPALAQQLRPEESTGLALPLLFSRSLGQLCGPMLLNGQKMPEHVQRNGLLIGCLLLFPGAYATLPLLSTVTFGALVAIFIAHLASNVVFALGTFSILHHFSSRQVASASAHAWRWQTLSATLFTALAAGLTRHLSASLTLWCVSMAALLLVSSVLFFFRE